MIGNAIKSLRAGPKIEPTKTWLDLGRPQFHQLLLSQGFEPLADLSKILPILLIGIFALALGLIASFL